MSYLDHLKKKKPIGNFSMDRTFVDVKVTRPKTSVPRTTKSKSRLTTAQTNNTSTEKDPREKQISKSSTANYPVNNHGYNSTEVQNYNDEFDKFETLNSRMNLNAESLSKDEGDSFVNKHTKSKDSLRSTKSAKAVTFGNKEPKTQENIDYLKDCIQTVDKNIKLLDKPESFKLTNQDTSKLDVFAIEINSEGSITTGINLNGNIINVENQIGNLELVNKAIKAKKDNFLQSFMIKNKLILEKQKSKLQNSNDGLVDDPKRDNDLKQIENDISTLEGYTNLIKFCFKHIGKSGDDLDVVDYGYFRVF
jgi:hypothetical protein